MHAWCLGGDSAGCRQERDSQEGSRWRERWRGCCSCQCVLAFWLKNFLPLGFAICIIWMLVWPWPGQKIEAWRVRYAADPSLFSVTQVVDS